jgi:hypothetical protein
MHDNIAGNRPPLRGISARQVKNWLMTQDDARLQYYLLFRGVCPES